MGTNFVTVKQKYNTASGNIVLSMKSSVNIHNPNISLYKSVASGRSEGDSIIFFRGWHVSHYARKFHKQWIYICFLFGFHFT